MKKAILIFIVTLLFTGCLEEEWDDCNSTLYLTFQHNKSTEEFDAKIGNDVQVYVYKNDKLHHSVKVPYSDIQGGKEVPIKKSFTGQLSIAAWAVPNGGGDVGAIPVFEKDSKFSASTIKHADITTNNSSLCSPVPDLYLGTLKEQDEFIMEDSHYKIDMGNTICRVEVIVEPIGLIDSYLVNGAPSIRVGGSSRGATLDLEPSGDEVLVYSELRENNSEDIYSTGVFGMMPSYKDSDKFPEGKPISITGFAGDTQMFTIEDTDQYSRPGDKVKIVITGPTAQIYVNGWRVKTTNVTF